MDKIYMVKKEIFGNLSSAVDYAVDDLQRCHRGNFLNKKSYTLTHNYDTNRVAVIGQNADGPCIWYRDIKEVYIDELVKESEKNIDYVTIFN